MIINNTKMSQRLNAVLGRASLIALIFVAGCKSGADWGKYRGEAHSHKISYKDGDVLYQAWDHQFPEISPAFASKEDAQEYVDRNNYNGRSPTGHKYIVREIDHRYEVRHQNDAVSDVIFTSSNLSESEEYLNVYKANHTDLFIFDLLFQEVVGVSTP